MEYYDGTKLLSMMDINNNQPEIYLCDGNRTAGKTTFFARLLVNKFLRDKDGQFIILYRYKYEIEHALDKFFGTIQPLFFPTRKFTKGALIEHAALPLFVDNKLCGYAVAINASEQIKKMSHMFHNVNRMFFDEFQSESNNYVSNEIQKLISIHASVARGINQPTRRVPLYMCSNSISILNPYYSHFKISTRLTQSTKFLKGNGWVLEHVLNTDVKEMQSNSAFNNAFFADSYMASAIDNNYLDDSKAFIEKPDGRSSYIATFSCDDELYAIKEYSPLIYCDDKIDNTHPVKLSVRSGFPLKNFTTISNQQLLINMLRDRFQLGLFRFKNLKCKNAILSLLSY